MPWRLGTYNHRDQAPCAAMPRPAPQPSAVRRNPQNHDDNVACTARVSGGLPPRTSGINQSPPLKPLALHLLTRLAI